MAPHSENATDKIGEKHAMEHKDTSRPDLAKELWFRREEQKALEDMTITATIRAGDRTEITSDNKGGYKPGDFITAKIQKEDGGFEDWERILVPVSTEKKRIANLSAADLVGSSQEGLTNGDLAAKLKELYGRDFKDSEEVTIVRFEYKDRLQGVDDLMRTGVLTLAKEPPDNEENLNAERYTIPLSADDYPAATPIMWNTVYRDLGFNAANVLMVANPANSEHILDVLRRDPKYLGGGAAVGFKEQTIPHLDVVDELADTMESVNFIMKNEKGELVGYNTDAIGYVRSLEEKFEKMGAQLVDMKIVLLGGGGTANAIAYLLAEKQARVTILNRTVEKAEIIADRINNLLGKDEGSGVRAGGEDAIVSEVTHADAIVNVSLKGAAGELEKYSALAAATLPATFENVEANLSQAAKTLAKVNKGTIVSDITITKTGTPYLNAAQAAGYTTLDGKPMVVYQGAEALWLLHGPELVEKGYTKEQITDMMKEAAGVTE
ncbi:hypothetical protein ACFL2D_02490 [Patescibacteria group bacterium]